MVGDATQGRRVYPANKTEWLDMQPGDYALFDGHWWHIPPASGYGLGKLCLHTVIEHEDGTITVSPSILDTGVNHRQWHGYLERGVWREV